MAAKVVRVLEAFRKDTETLAFETPLRDIGLRTLQMIFGVPESNPMYDCWPVEVGHVPLLQPYVDCSIDLDRYDYFVSAYTEPTAL
ncbi:MAG: DUF7683 domain-containing protein [Bryobacteraceae bacterium]